MLGRESEIGPLTPGKRADLVIINADDLTLPGPRSRCISGDADDLANIEAVMIGGSWKNRNGKLLLDGLAQKKEHLAQSGQRLVREIERQGRAAG